MQGWDYAAIAEECLPLWGKWIEMTWVHSACLRRLRVFPCGGSGLKYASFAAGTAGDGVSSPVGEVD